MKSADFLARLEQAANSKTLYVKGGFGAPASAANKQRYAQSCVYNKNRAQMIMAATPDTFFFDCVNLLKGILWGWTGDTSQQYGGAVYASNGVPDIGEDELITKCTNVSTNFAHIVPGAMVWNRGHAGAYFGSGLVVECTPSWANGVQFTALGNKGSIQGYPTRSWTKWGLLPWVDYAPADIPSPFSQEDFDRMMDNWLARQKTLPASKYALEPLEWAEANEIIFGDASGNLMPQSLVKRQDVIVFLKRFFDNLC